MKTILFLLFLCFGGIVFAQKPLNSSIINSDFSRTLIGFLHPQDSARTKLWWFHGQTETTKEGITKDLEAFKEEGVGGVVFYDQVHGNAEGALPAMSPDWYKMLRFAAEEAKRLGLTFELNVSNGFVAGGPWITPDLGMQRLVSADTVVNGSQYFRAKLPVPQNRFKYFADVKVLAYPIRDDARLNVGNYACKLASSIVALDPKALFDRSKRELVLVPAQKQGKSVYINIDFEKEFPARSISYWLRPNGKATTSATNVPEPPNQTFVGTGYRILPPIGTLEVSVDGAYYHKVCDLRPAYTAHESFWQKTVSFNTIRSKHFRLSFKDWGYNTTYKDSNLLIGKINLTSDAKVQCSEEKSANVSEYIEANRTNVIYPSDETIQSSQIIDISNKLAPDGTLTWDIPDGRWAIMRFCHIPTGGSLKHGRQNLMGLECDKMSVHAAEIQFKNYFEKIMDSLSVSSSGKLSGLTIDSHEAGSQNWTSDFIQEFTKRRGYDPVPMLPVMMGYVVESTDESEKFLYDIRRTIADMISDNYYGTFERLCRQKGVTLTAQATGNALCIVADPIQAKSKVHKPQGEFWIIHPDGNYDIKECSSSAHLYGKQIASAEAFTGALYNHTMADLKSIADGAYAFGINEFVVCASAYQPWGDDKLPGNMGGGWQWVANRNNTWWKFSREFWDYQSRCAYILRQGLAAVNLCIYLGDNAPVKILTYRLPEIPAGYSWDAFTQDALLSRMDVQDDLITLPDGLTYSMMILPRSGELTLSALQKIAQMVERGMKVYGSKPLESPSKMDIGKEKEYRDLADLLWGKESGYEGMIKHGTGSVYFGMKLERALKLAEVVPDLSSGQSNLDDLKVRFAHRELADADIYFVNNHKETAEQGIFSFRTNRLWAQLWDPETGKRYSLPIHKKVNGVLSLNLKLAPNQSFFIIFTDIAESLSPPIFHNSSRQIVIQGDWNVYFSEKLGGPGWVKYDQLKDWSTDPDPRIKYYSGTAVYKTSFQISSVDQSERILIDLGKSTNVSEIYINGKKAGTIWCSPWQLDITNLIFKGINQLEIRTANTWTNRLIGDAALPENNRVTYTTSSMAKKTDNLQMAGLTHEIKILFFKNK